MVAGPEEYQCRQAISLIKKRALTEEALAFNYTEFDAEHSPMRDVVAIANTYPMMFPRRVILVANLEKIRSPDQEALLDYIEDPSSRTVFILSADKLDRRTAFYKRLIEKACVVEFPKLKGIALERWAEDYLQRHRFRLSPASLKKVVDLAGEDVQSLASELEKLLIYGTKERTVHDEAINDLISRSRQHSIFEFTRALGLRDRAGALRQLANLVDSGEHYLLILSMMARHFRQILIAKDLMDRGTSPRDAAAAAQVPSFILDEFLRQARAIDWSTSRAIYVQLARADYLLKSSPADGRMVLEDLVCSL